MFTSERKNGVFAQKSLWRSLFIRFRVIKERKPHVVQTMLFVSMHCECWESCYIYHVGPFALFGPSLGTLVKQTMMLLQLSAAVLQALSVLSRHKTSEEEFTGVSHVRTPRRNAM
jgi:hypothetical protein